MITEEIKSFSEGILTLSGGVGGLCSRWRICPPNSNRLKLYKSSKLYLRNKNLKYVDSQIIHSLTPPFSLIEYFYLCYENKKQRSWKTINK
jgi:hypothetical protein